ncbi:glyoxalase family protein [Amaricoccus macauensis]|uniref:Glyoxalase family protein n=1 Tax=Amaricoccus macauensis TaxID=57001 RepID=A0A840SPK9_9RHOB|nr:ring-cleaving dioxygenase [Amaricoccus macauensis]MBB5223957.1 glyoxalase family protein [Amaricoccus macauensis]
MDLNLTGLHHVTAITADAAGNRRFYTDTLGLRLVKKTVNQDDTSAYHLFYADGLASPGTDLTFFDWPAPPEKRGTHAISRTGLRVAGEPGLLWWKERLGTAGVRVGEIAEVDGRATLDFEDPEGQRLRLTDDGGAGPAHPWAQSPVPAGHQIRGLGPVTISVPKLDPTAALLTRVLGMAELRAYASPDGEGEVRVFGMGEGGLAAAGPASELHVAVQPGLPVARQGSGAVHHVAFRTPNIELMHDWTRHLAASGVPTSGEVERYYFRSLYFREPGGNLFEIATDGPGFAVDEPLESLGERLSLPPFLEGNRAAIEAGLKPIG